MRFLRRSSTEDARMCYKYVSAYIYIQVIPIEIILNRNYIDIELVHWYISELVHFVVTILFVLTLASDMALLYGNDAFSTLVLSPKKTYSNFLKKYFVFQKICFKIKVMKKFKTFSDCYVKTCLSLKPRAILKIPSTVF